jgi:type IV pilus assembly protein PilA
VLQNTLKKIRARRDGEEGFTLIELMVVVLIIAILIAIAIPTFLGAKSRAQDKAAQSNLRNGITAAKTVFSDHQDYADATTAALVQVEPSLNFVAANTTSNVPKDVSVLVADSDANAANGMDTIYMASVAKSGKCWAAKDTQTGTAAATQYGELKTGACNATNASTGVTNWADSF